MRMDKLVKTAKVALAAATFAIDRPYTYRVPDALAEKLAVKNATLMWPVRIAAAGKAVTPGGAVEICHVLGREETLRRLRLGLDKLR